MTQIVWDQSGERFFELGVDRGVLFAQGSPSGVPWNGLIAVTDSPTGGQAQPYYIDGIKYLNVPSREQLFGTIEAFTYPDEFAVCDGSIEVFPGFSIQQQPRLPFAISFRTKVGNDVDGEDHGYKLHIIYNLLATPTTRKYATVGDTPSPVNFSWSFSTKPLPLGFVGQRTAHVIIDSRKTSPVILRLIEETIYGTIFNDSSLMTPEDIRLLFEMDPRILEIHPNMESGLALLTEALDGDLQGNITTGLYKRAVSTRLRETIDPGLSTLEE